MEITYGSVIPEFPGLARADKWVDRWCAWFVFHGLELLRKLRHSQLVVGAVEFSEFNTFPRVLLLSLVKFLEVFQKLNAVGIVAGVFCYLRMLGCQVKRRDIRVLPIDDVYRKKCS